MTKSQETFMHFAHIYTAMKRLAAIRGAPNLEVITSLRYTQIEVSLSFHETFPGYC